MAIAKLEINLAPQYTFWQIHHKLLSWISLFLGIFLLLTASIALLTFYNETKRKQIDFLLQEENKSKNNIDDLQNLNVPNILSTWHLVERFYVERNASLSNITNILERNLVQGVRLYSIRRNAFLKDSIKIEIKGEAKTYDDEMAFIEALRKESFFKQVFLVDEDSQKNNSIAFTCILDTNVTTDDIYS